MEVEIKVNKHVNSTLVFINLFFVILFFLSASCNRVDDGVEKVEIGEEQRKETSQVNSNDKLKEDLDSSSQLQKPNITSDKKVKTQEPIIKKQPLQKVYKTLKPKTSESNKSADITTTTGSKTSESPVIVLSEEEREVTSSRLSETMNTMDNNGDDSQAKRELSSNTKKQLQKLHEKIGRKETSKKNDTQKKEEPKNDTEHRTDDETDKALKRLHNRLNEDANKSIDNEKKTGE